MFLHEQACLCCVHASALLLGVSPCSDSLSAFIPCLYVSSSYAMPVCIQCTIISISKDRALSFTCLYMH